MNTSPDSAARIERLHAPGVVDMHFDLPMDLYEKRKETGVLDRDFLPRFQAGGIGVVGAAIYLIDQYVPELALRVTLDMIARLYIEIDHSQSFALCRTYDDIVRARQAGKIALILTLEGAEPLGNDLNLVRVLYELGLRQVGLTHARRNMAADGALFKPSGSSKEGLTAFGRELVQMCEELGIVIDLAHINAAGFEDVIALTRRPVIVSHTNSRKYFDMERNISDEQVKMVGERGGVVGVNAVLVSSRPDEAHLDKYIDHIEHFAGLIGLDHVGIGFDFYKSVLPNLLPPTPPPGQTSALPRPSDIPDLSDHAHARNLTRRLIERGYSDTDIEKILYGNWLRLFQESM